MGKNEKPTEILQPTLADKAKDVHMGFLYGRETYLGARDLTKQIYNDASNTPPAVFFGSLRGTYHDFMLKHIPERPQETAKFDQLHTKLTTDLEDLKREKALLSKYEKKMRENEGSDRRRAVKDLAEEAEYNAYFKRG